MKVKGMKVVATLLACVAGLTLSVGTALGAVAASHTTQAAGAIIGFAVAQIDPAACGDGVLDGGEECDDGNTDDGDCCAADCTFEAVDSPCGDPTDSACNHPDTCDGVGACEGNLEPTSTVCRAAADDCDVEEFCDGLGDCQADEFAAVDTPCGDNADTDCDNPDTCDDAGVCLANNEEDDTPCSDDLFCNGEETCLVGECVDNEDPCLVPDERCDEELDICLLAPALDIKPGSCPNRVNRDSRGVVTVALVGSAVFDVAEIDYDTLAFGRVDGIGGFVSPLMGPHGPGISVSDAASAFDGIDCECHELEGDGMDDLILKFRTPALNETLQLDEFAHKQAVELILIGELFDGTPFEATDCIEVLHSRGKRPLRSRR